MGRQNPELEDTTFGVSLRNNYTQLPQIEDEENPNESVKNGVRRDSREEEEDASDNDDAPTPLPIDSIEGGNESGGYWPRGSLSGRRAVYCPPATVQIEFCNDDSPRRTASVRQQPPQQGNNPISPSLCPSVTLPVEETRRHRHQSPTTTTTTPSKSATENNAKRDIPILTANNKKSVPVNVVVADDNCCPNNSRSNSVAASADIRGGGGDGGDHRRTRSGTIVTKFNFRLRKETIVAKRQQQQQQQQERGSQSMAHRREKKATKTLAIVLGWSLLRSLSLSYIISLVSVLYLSQENILFHPNGWKSRGYLT